MYLMAAFDEIHFTLRRGSAWEGNSLVPDVCLLASTAAVTYQYEERVLPKLRKVVHRLPLTDADWRDIDGSTVLLLGGMGKLPHAG